MQDAEKMLLIEKAEFVMTTVNLRVTLPDEQTIEKFIYAMQEIGVSVETDDEVVSWEDARQTLFSNKSREEIAGGTLRAARERAGLTQSQLGELVGDTKHNISMMEHGKRTITPEKAQLYSKAFEAYFKIDYHAFL